MIETLSLILEISWKILGIIVAVFLTIVVITLGYGCIVSILQNLPSLKDMRKQENAESRNSL